MKTEKPSASTVPCTETLIPSPTEPKTSETRSRDKLRPKNAAGNGLGNRDGSHRKSEGTGDRKTQAELAIEKAREGWIAAHNARLKKARKELRRRIAKAREAARLKRERDETKS